MNPAADTKPRVTVVIPLYNLGGYVGEAIDSVLAQSLPQSAVEIIVVDDGSTDGGGEVAQRYLPRLRYVRQENRGVSAARNAGIRLARAPLLTFLDADDRILPGKLEAQVDVLTARPEVGLVYTGFRFIDAAGRSLGEARWSRDEGNVFRRLVLGNLIHPHLAVVRREPVEAIGGFDERLGGTADWDFWLRLSRNGVRWACVDAPLAEYRIRPGAMHQDPDVMLADSLRVLDKLFGEPELPADLRELGPLAYQRVFLAAACAHYRAGDRLAGVRCLRDAARARPRFLVEPDSLRLFCRWLLPPERQREEAVVADWRRVSTVLRTALADLFDSSLAERPIRRLRHRSAVAAWRTTVRLARKRLSRNLLDRGGNAPGALGAGR